MPRWRRWIFVGVLGSAVLHHGRPARAAAEVKLGKDFLNGIVAKLPPTSFDKADKYRGTVHSYRLIAIDPRTRRFLIACQIEGEFHPPVTGPISERVGRSPQTPEGWRKFRFDVKARVNIEPGLDGAPRFRIEIDEVKKRELDGFSGVVARFLGQYFDELVTQIASGRASRLNKRLNDEIMKRVALFKEYGVFRAIDYTPVGSGPPLRRDAVPVRRHRRLRFRRRSGRAPFPSIAGSIPEMVPTTTRSGPTHPTGPTRSATASPVTSTTIRSPKQSRFIDWRNRRDDLYTTSADGENAGRAGYRPQGIAGYHLSRSQTGDGSALPLLRPSPAPTLLHAHPHAEFAK